MTVLTVYIFLYGRVYLIGIFTAVPMIMGFILELGLMKAIFSFITMQLQFCSVFFTFSLGTRTHYFGRTILHGGAKYRATGRGFVVRHIKFADNYRLYSRSHFVKASWFMVISWLFAPYIFNPSGFEWQKTVEDFDDWTNWLFYKGGVGVKGENSWESWWDEEQYGIVYKLKITGHNTSLAGLLAIGIIAAIACLIGFTDFTIADLFASALAFLATGWCILCLAITWRRVVKTLGLWDSVREISRMYDAGMGAVIFAPIVFFSWFPFVSTFQSRILFNQAFSRGLEISLILAGNKANQES
ncbi:unnamed protein product [Triticum turgidum subsp. durum]|uniref:Glycosyl transferase 48 domain-containing protein n=1 Tax=Triticum turgidum subsp. durum TaxID=4567 RepID=A0A9R0W5L4_TRITD|nr:unnamed protein product [Triticum turgidum subsp. durum]